MNLSDGIKPEQIKKERESLIGRLETPLLVLGLVWLALLRQ